MIAADTNVLLRLLMADDEKQVARASRLLSENIIFVPASVWLELEWVLRGVFSLPREAVQEAFLKLYRNERISTDIAAILDVALEHHASGCDFADAMHLAYSTNCAGFATFDKEFVKFARKAKSGPEVFSP